MVGSYVKFAFALGRCAKFIILPPHRQTTTEIKPEGLELFATELLQQPDGMEIWNNIRMWGHSHVNMGLTPSAQDNTQMKEFSEIGQEWFIRLIANKKGEMKVDLFHYEKGLYFTDVPWEILDTEDPENEVEILRAQIAEMERQLAIATTAKVTEMKTEIVAEMKEKVSKISYVKPFTPHSSHNASYNEQYKKKPIVSSYGRNCGYGYKTWKDFPPTDEEMKLYLVEIPKYIQDEYWDKKKHNTPITLLTDAGDVEDVTNDDFSILANRQAVYSFFNQRELETIGLDCRSVEDLEFDIEDYGYKNQFSSADLKLILDVAQAETDRYFDRWGGFS